MRLLHTRTLDLEPFYDDQTWPRYVGLSHTWHTGLLSYPDLADPQRAASGPGSELLRRACNTAQDLGYDYIWAECVCVDGSSTAEVSEAVNSAFQWFQQAATCLVYLADLPPDAPDDEASWRQCAWWTRAWTLPELLAPSTVRFYDKDWNFRGTKTSAPLLGLISRITHVSEDVLRDGSLIRQVSVAKRMSWAASRKARRVEDRAYSLLGIFGVHMQAIYGEGEASFARLQEEIIKDSRDMSLLAWEAQPNDKQPYRGLLASSPAEFARFVQCPPEWSTPFAFGGEIRSTGGGLSITAPFISYPGQSQQILLLDLGAQHVPQRKAALLLFRYNGYYVRPARNAIGTLVEPGNSTTRNVFAVRKLDALTSRVICDKLRVPVLANGDVTLPPKTPGSPVPAGLPLRGPSHAAALARRRGGGSIAESSSTYVISRASISRASMSPMLNASVKRSLPTTALPHRGDKRARTKPCIFPADPESEVTALRDDRSDASGSTSSREDLSVSDGSAPGPPPTLDAGHPFLAVADELTEAARSAFAKWRKTASPSGTYLACPFRARDPDCHAACLKRAALRQPRDVKVHLWRDHRLPHHCPVCYGIFGTASAKNEHIIQRSCELKPPPRLGGVSEDQKLKLAKKDCVSASREEQWYAIWDVIFPGEEPPSPYPKGGDAVVSLAREFWEERGQLVVSGFLDERGMLEYEVKDEERGLAALYALVLERILDAVCEEEGWVVVSRDAPAGALRPERSLWNGFLPSASVSMLGMPAILFRGAELPPAPPGAQGGSLSQPRRHGREAGAASVTP